MRRLGALAIVLVIAACGQNSPSAPQPSDPVTSLAVLPHTDTIFVGDTVTIAAIVTDSTGQQLQNRQVTWQVPDTTRLGIIPSIVTAQVYGRNIGTALLIGAISGFVDTARLTMRFRVATVTITPRPTALVIGDTIRLTAILKDSAGDTLSGRPIVWVATAESYEMVHTVGPGQFQILGGGDTYITATSEGKQDSIYARLTADAPLTTLAITEEAGCAISGQGTLYCWGDNGWGQLTVNSPAARFWSIRGTDLAIAVSRIAGGLHSLCALDGQGGTWCWGLDDYGQLGNSNDLQSCSLEPCRGVPELVTSAPAFDSLTLGITHGCGLTANGAAWCWGSNSWGELGTGAADTAQHGATAVVGSTSYVAISAGGSHTCALDAGGLAWCWGSNVRGELGQGTFDSLSHATPDTVYGGLRFKAIAAGPSYTCALTTNSLAYCWGTDEIAQLGLGAGDSLPHPTPAPVVGAMQFNTLKTGYEHACALTSSGAAYCWGKNEFGELGSTPSGQACRYYSALYACSGTPLAVTGGLTFSDIRPARYTTCGLGTDGYAYCWGANGVGQLGNETFDDSATPVPLVGQPAAGPDGLRSVTRPRSMVRRTRRPARPAQN